MTSGETSLLPTDLSQNPDRETLTWTTKTYLGVSDSSRTGLVGRLSWVDLTSSYKVIKQEIIKTRLVLVRIEQKTFGNLNVPLSGPSHYSEPRWENGPIFPARFTEEKKSKKI